MLQQLIKPQEDLVLVYDTISKKEINKNIINDAFVERRHFFAFESDYVR